MTRLTHTDEERLVDGIASLVDAGLEVVDAYRALAADRSAYARRIREVAAAVVADLERGLDLRTSVTSSVSRIDPVHEAMLALVDATGDARASFARARRVLATRRRVREQTAGALLYPAIVAVLALAGSVALVVVVIPAAQRLLVPLAGPNASIASLLVRARTALAVIATVAAGAGSAVWLFVASRRSERATPRIDRIRLRLPVFGRSELTADLFACTSALAGTTRVGLPLVEALGVAARCCANAVVSERLLAAAASVSRGGYPGEALARAMAGVPAAAYRFALCGSGSDVATTAEAVADDLARRLERTAALLNAVLEPALVIVVGGAIVALVLTLVAPLFTLYAEVLP